MAKGIAAGVGWVPIVVVLNWYFEKIVGDFAGTPCTAKHGLAALDRAVDLPFPSGTRGQGCPC